jgi:hypothetical protein
LQLNAKIDESESLNLRLTAENGVLRDWRERDAAQIHELEAENERLTAENERLTAENVRLNDLQLANPGQTHRLRLTNSGPDQDRYGAHPHADYAPGEAGVTKREQDPRARTLGDPVGGPGAAEGLGSGGPVPGGRRLGPGQARPLTTRRSAYWSGGGAVRIL